MIPKSLQELGRRVLTWNPILFARRQFSDTTLGLTAEESELLSSMKISERSIYGDRYYELREYYGASQLSCLMHFLLKGWPRSQRYRDNLMRKFEGNTSPDRLFTAYEKTAFVYSTELMLRMHRTEWLIPFLASIEKQLGPLADLRILEYGCGVSDFGIFFALKGAKVSIADLQNDKLEFAKWRYTVRQLPCNAIPINDTEIVPDLGCDRYDLVVATEILEHVRNPLHLLRALTFSLRCGGLLFSSMGTSFERDIGGDHLRESSAIGNSEEYKTFFSQHYHIHEKSGEKPWLFTRMR